MKGLKELPGFTLLKRAAYFGTGRYCPVCASTIRLFKPSGVTPRPDARCPVCGALERHRLAWIFLKTRTNLFDGMPKSMLHISPEAAIERKLRRVSGLAYITADLTGDAASLYMDVSNIPFPDEVFDIVFCSHVLEHVPDDRRAMREIRRVLKAEGKAIMIVPVTSSATFEDPSVTSPIERASLFGQPDHVRRYGPDFGRRMEAEGFIVQLIRETDLISHNDAERSGVRGESLFYAQRTPG